MNYYVIPLFMLAFVPLTAFGEITNVNLWVGPDNIEHIYIDFQCRELGEGQIRYNFYDEYVHVQYYSNYENNISQRQFTYDQYNQDIRGFYLMLVSPSSVLC
jgi:hypothetical protein